MVPLGHRYAIDLSGASTVSPMRHIPGAWHRTAAGAGLVGPDGSIHPTIFAEMSALAAETGAINLGQGFPDEDGPAELLEAASADISAKMVGWIDPSEPTSPAPAAVRCQAPGMCRIGLTLLDALRSIA